LSVTEKAPNARQPERLIGTVIDSGRGCALHGFL